MHEQHIQLFETRYTRLRNDDALFFLFEYADITLRNTPLTRLVTTASYFA